MVPVCGAGQGTFRSSTGGADGHEPGGGVGGGGGGGGGGCDGNVTVDGNADPCAATLPDDESRPVVRTGRNCWNVGIWIDRPAVGLRSGSIRACLGTGLGVFCASPWANTVPTLIATAIARMFRVIDPSLGDLRLQPLEEEWRLRQTNAA
jgi:hypothetical protein